MSYIVYILIYTHSSYDNKQLEWMNLAKKHKKQIKFTILATSFSEKNGEARTENNFFLIFRPCSTIPHGLFMLVNMLEKQKNIMGH